MRRLRSIPFVLLAALAFSDCFQSRSETCPSGMVCPAGSHCAAHQNVCIPTNCGDGVVNRDEVCDDGNVIRGDGCSADCKSTEHCGNGIVDIAVGEVCDDGNTASGDGCNSDCTTKEGCGNGKIDLGEECDDGNLNDDDNCTSHCEVAFCGDGFVNDAGTLDGGHREYCDIALTPPTACPYGQTCQQCDYCTGFLTVSGPYCGDSLVEPGVEICDDGNNAGETSCPYGADGGRCAACSANCQDILDLTGPYCGDGNVDVGAGGEACDDGNADNCGTCSADCKMRQSGAATGKIIAIAANKIFDGESFTLSDGVTAKTFEFHKNSTPPDAGVVVVLLGAFDNASTVAAKITNSVNADAIQITATTSSSLVSLANERIGSGNSGNWPITETVAYTGFQVEGMSGGGGYDCPAGTRCTSDIDCVLGLTCQVSDGGAGSIRTCQ